MLNENASSVSCAAPSTSEAEGLYAWKSHLLGQAWQLCKFQFIFQFVSINSVVGICNNSNDEVMHVDKVEKVHNVEKEGRARSKDDGKTEKESMLPHVLALSKTCLLNIGVDILTSLQHRYSMVWYEML